MVRPYQPPKQGKVLDRSSIFFCCSFFCSFLTVRCYTDRSYVQQFVVTHTSIITETVRCYTDRSYFTTVRCWFITVSLLHRPFSFYNSSLLPRPFLFLLFQVAILHRPFFLFYNSSLLLRLFIFYFFFAVS